MNAGRLRTRMKYLTKTTSADGRGGSSSSWSESFRFWGEDSLEEPTEAFSQGGALETVTHRIRARYDDRIAAGGRVELLDGTIIELSGVRDPDQRRRELVLVGTEARRNG